MELFRPQIQAGNQLKLPQIEVELNIGVYLNNHKDIDRQRSTIENDWLTVSCLKMSEV